MKNPKFEIRNSKFNSGQAALTAVILLVAVTLVITVGFSAVAINESRRSDTNLDGQKSYYLAEAGNEDVVYRLATGRTVSNQETIILDGHTASTTRTTVGGDEQVTTTGDIQNHIRRVQTLLTTADGAAFNYGLQSGNGGLVMENFSSVTGNVYSNGQIYGNNNNIIRGNVVSATTTGLINGIHATGSAYAHVISNSTVDKNAYYQTISGTTVRGTQYPNSPDQPKLDFPISDTMLDDWETAAAVTVINSPCPYKINDTAAIGPAKINCDVEISGNNYTLTLNGMLWINGNLDIKNSPKIKLAASLGNKSLAIIVDKTTNRLTASKATVANSPIFENSGTVGSYVLVVSRNNSSEGGGPEVAINFRNTASGDLILYSNHGEILIENNDGFKAITGYKIRTQNSAKVTYEDGLANVLFDAGPSGSFSINDWKEVE